MPFPLFAKGDSTDATLGYPGVNVIIFFSTSSLTLMQNELVLVLG